MQYSRTVSRLLASILVIAVPASAHAAGSDISQIFINVINDYGGIWIIIAVLIATIIGFTLMVSREENSIDKAKTALTALGIGIVMTVILTSPQVGGVTGVLSWIYEGRHTGDKLTWDAVNIATEAEGIADWIATLAAVAGIVMVIIAATRAVLSFGDEGKYAAVRTSVLHLIIGLIVIGGATIIKTVFFETHTADGAFISIFLNPLQTLISIMGIVAVGILIYAGFRMVISFGKEDEFSSARSLAIRAAIGLLILILSLVLVRLVQSCFTGSCSI